MEMTRIEKLADFTSALGKTVVFEASVLSIVHEGVKEDKKPIVAKMKLESTGENFDISTWNFDLLNKLKSMSHSLAIGSFEGAVTIYKEKTQIRVGKLKEILLTPSTQKKMSSTKSVEEDVKSFITSTIKDPICRAVLDTLVISNEKFFRWPAARSVHHNYPGGLALHSLNVARLCLAQMSIYDEECFDRDIVLTGALLHDIGKLQEYTEDSELSFEGNFSTHLVSGVLMLNQVMQSFTPCERLYKVKLILEHIIQSHHGTIEFGSPITPKMIEAVMVSMADLMDSKIESTSTMYRNMQEGTFSSPMRVIEGGRLYKWKEQL